MTYRNIKDSIVVATYNIHSCIGTDGKYFPERISSVINEISPDIMGLQEVDDGYFNPNKLDQLTIIKRQTGLIPYLGTTLRRGQASYGNVLLTRWPVNHIKRLDISVGDRENRGLLITEISFKEIKTRIFLTHLGLVRKERRIQIDEILSELTLKHDECSILLGDFNEWWWFSRLFREIDKKMGKSKAIRTFPTQFPMLTLDRIWVFPPERFVRVTAHKTALAKKASDHFPVVAKVAF